MGGVYVYGSDGLMPRKLEPLVVYVRLSNARLGAKLISAVSLKRVDVGVKGIPPTQ